MAGEVCWCVTAFLLGIPTCLLTVMSFSMPYWVTPTDPTHVSTTKLEKIGLWEACFDGYSDIRDGLGRTYYGCWWIFSREYDGIRKHLIPMWFAGAQALMTVSLVFTLCCSLIGLMMIIRCMPQKFQRISAAALALTYALIGILVGVTCITFGTHADTDRSWLKQPRFRKLSFSFYLAVVGGTLAFITAMLYCVYYMKIRKGGAQSTALRAYEMRNYRHQERHESRNKYYR